MPRTTELAAAEPAARPSLHTPEDEPQHIQPISDPLPGRIKRTLCSQPSAIAYVVGSQPLTSPSISNRIADCLSNGQPLISFNSKRGFSECRHLLNANHEKPPMPTKKPSLVQQCLQAQSRGMNYQVEHNGKTYTLSAVVNCVQGTEDPTKTPVIKGHLELVHSTNHEDKIAIPFIELAPAFDGYALKKACLEKCLNELNEFRMENHIQVDRVGGQFSSANGIGRSASLLVLDQFSQWANQQNGQMHTPQAIQEKVIELITNTRRVQPKAIAREAQVTELIEACRAIYTTANQPTTPAPERPAAAVFDENYWAWKPAAYAQIRPIAEFPTMENDAKDQLVDELRAASSSIKQTLQSAKNEGRPYPRWISSYTFTEFFSRLYDLCHIENRIFQLTEGNEAQKEINERRIATLKEIAAEVQNTHQDHRQNLRN